MPEGMQFLMSQSPDIKQKISSKYGSIGSFYQIVYALGSEDYKLATQKPSGYQMGQNAIRTRILDIDEELESFGCTDGSEITSAITSDFGETQQTSLNIPPLKNKPASLWTKFLKLFTSRS
jgi:hypothetical protein